MIVAAVMLGSVEWITRTPAPAPTAASDVRAHAHECPVCQLPLHGRANESSRFGPEHRAAVDLNDNSHK